MDNSKCIECLLYSRICARHHFQKTILTMTKLSYQQLAFLSSFMSVPPCFVCVFPVSHQPTAIWCQSPPFDGNSLPIGVPVTALLLHLKQTCIQSLQSSTYGQHLTPLSVKFSLPSFVRAPTSPGFPLASLDISSQSSLKRLVCIPKEVIFANPSLSSIGALPERPYVLTTLVSCDSQSFILSSVLYPEPQMCMYF